MALPFRSGRPAASQQSAGLPEIPDENTLQFDEDEGLSPADTVSSNPFKRAMSDGQPSLSPVGDLGNDDVYDFSNDVYGAPPMDDTPQQTVQSASYATRPASSVPPTQSYSASNAPTMPARMTNPIPPVSYQTEVHSPSSGNGSSTARTRRSNRVATNDTSRQASSRKSRNDADSYGRNQSSRQSTSPAKAGTVDGFHFDTSSIKMPKMLRGGNGGTSTDNTPYPVSNQNKDKGNKPVKKKVRVRSTVVRKTKTSSTDSVRTPAPVQQDMFSVPSSMMDTSATQSSIPNYQSGQQSMPSGYGYDDGQDDLYAPIGGTPSSTSPIDDSSYAMDTSSSYGMPSISNAPSLPDVGAGMDYADDDFSGIPAGAIPQTSVPDPMPSTSQDTSYGTSMPSIPSGAGMDTGELHPMDAYASSRSTGSSMPDDDLFGLEDNDSASDPLGSLPPADSVPSDFENGLDDMIGLDSGTVRSEINAAQKENAIQRSNAGSPKRSLSAMAGNRGKQQQNNGKPVELDPLMIDNTVPVYSQLEASGDTDSLSLGGLPQPKGGQPMQSHYRMFDGNSMGVQDRGIAAMPIPKYQDGKLLRTGSGIPIQQADANDGKKKKRKVKPAKSKKNQPLWLPYYGCPPADAIVRYFKKFNTSSGRASKSEYWWGMIFGGLILGVPINILQGLKGIFIIPALILALGFLAASISLGIRRCHDSNHGGIVFVLSVIAEVFGYLAFPIGLGMFTEQKLNEFQETARSIGNSATVIANAGQTASNTASTVSATVSSSPLDGLGGLVMVVGGLAFLAGFILFVLVGVWATDEEGQQYDKIPEGEQRPDMRKKGPVNPMTRGVASVESYDDDVDNEPDMKPSRSKEKKPKKERGGGLFGGGSKSKKPKKQKAVKSGPDIDEDSGLDFSDFPDVSGSNDFGF